VGDHDDGHAELRLEFAEKGEDGFAGGGIEIAGGLVGERILGRLTRARAMATRCCSPPESSVGRWPRRCVRQRVRGFANAGGALGAVDFSEAKREFPMFSLEGHAREKVED